MIRCCILAAVALISLTPTTGFAQAASDRSLDQFTCKQVMREAPAVREATIAFMHGYLLGKSSSMKFNIETLLEHTDRFVDSCLDNPGAKAIDIMVKASS